MVEIGKLHYFTDRSGWRSWLAKNHASTPEAWLVISRRGSARETLTLDEAVEEALCFGWIDGLLHRLDAVSFALRFSPRKPGSVWSEINKQRVMRLIEAGKMTEAGLEKVRLAQQSGEWQRATSREVLEELPSELEAALAADPQARLGFEGMVPSRRKQLIGWIAGARREDTRQRRVAETIRLAKQKLGVD